MDVLSVVAWPVVVLLLAVIFLLLFKSSIAGLIDRTRKVGKSGIETFEAQPAQLPKPADANGGLQKYMQTYDSPVLLEAERGVQRDLESLGIIQPEEKEKALVRTVAALNVVLNFERVYGDIWASQRAALEIVNTHPHGLPRESLIPLFERARSEYPQLYEKDTFDRWLGYLTSIGFLEIKDGGVVITISGREFLKFLVSTGRGGPIHG